MVNAATPSGQSSVATNVFARFIGIITSPRATFASVAAHPKWFGMLVLICGISAVLLGVFFSTETGKNAWIEAATTGPMAPAEMNDQQYAAIERMAGFAAPLAVGQAVIGTPIIMALVALILWAIFNAALGGNATFKQIFAVVVHAWVIIAASQFFTLPLSYMSGQLTSATSLGVLVPMLDEESFIARFLGSIDFFLAWSLITLAIGLAVLFRRRTQPIAIILLSVYVLIALVIAVVRSN